MLSGSRIPSLRRETASQQRATAEPATGKEFPPLQEDSSCHATWREDLRCADLLIGSTEDLAIKRVTPEFSIVTGGSTD
jgi:hypothetical protein